MSVDALRKACEALYYNGSTIPRTVAEATDFVRAVGVHPNAAIVEQLWKKQQRRYQAAAASVTIVPFADLFAIVQACHVDATKMDPTQAEDQEYFLEAWQSCGGAPIDLSASSSANTATNAVQTSSVVQMLAAIGLDTEPVQHQRRLNAAIAAARASRTGAADPEQMSYKDFVDLISGQQQEAQSAAEAGEAPPPPPPEPMYRPDDADSYMRPRLSFMMMMRVKAVVRAFRRRRLERITREKRERELDEYARRYFGFSTDLFSPDDLRTRSHRLKSVVSSTPEPLQSLPSMAGSAFNEQKSQALVPSKSQAKMTLQPAASSANLPAGGGASVVRARRANQQLPPLVNERESLYDAALAHQEAADRRHQRELRQARLTALLKTHPRRDGCADVVQRYAKAPVESPLKSRKSDRAESSMGHGSMGRPRPRALSPTQLQAKRAPTPQARRAPSRQR
jgi:hypothetical protein